MFEEKKTGQVLCIFCMCPMVKDKIKLYKYCEAGVAFSDGYKRALQLGKMSQKKIDKTVPVLYCPGRFR